MSNRTKGPQRFSVTGPGVDSSYAAFPVALSAAVTYADHLKEAGTVYVRDLDDSVVAWVEKDKQGVTRVHDEPVPVTA